MTDRKKTKHTQMGVNTVSTVMMAGSETSHWEDVRGRSDGGFFQFLRSGV